MPSIPWMIKSEAWCSAGPSMCLLPLNGTQWSRESISIVYFFKIFVTHGNLYPFVIKMPLRIHFSATKHVTVKISFANVHYTHRCNCIIGIMAFKCKTMMHCSITYNRRLLFVIQYMVSFFYFYTGDLSVQYLWRLVK